MRDIQLYTNSFFQLLRVEIAIYFRKLFVSHFINTLIWAISDLMVTTYIFPMWGFTKDYVSFYAIGTIASCALFGIVLNVTSFICDIEANRNLHEQLLIPIPSWLIFLKNALFYSLKAAIFSIVLLPLGKIMLAENLDLSQLSYLKFGAIFTAICLLTGSMSIMIASFTPTLEEIEDVWNRVLFPLWCFGSTQFSWESLYSFSPKLAYLCLFNPFMYATEGLRSATLGSSGNLPFWLCLLVTITCTVSFFLIGLRQLKKKLDFV